jgi:DUF1680 family protein
MVGLGPYGPEYHQDHVPLREAVEAAGHAVRQLYLTSGATDLYLETGDAELLHAMERLWRDIVGRKLFVTGGLGSRLDGEAFGDAYELPSDQCYCETCAAIGSVFWNWRLLLALGDARFADLVERTLYNAVLCSPALDGCHFFYMNPLMVRGAKSLRVSTNRPSEQPREAPGRPEWHEVACCPPNVMRLLASAAHYLATQDGCGLQIHQYAPCEINWRRPDGHVLSLGVSTEMPWQGQTRVEVRETDGDRWTLRLRKPGWSRGVQVELNGRVLRTPTEDGYIVLERAWNVGDIVQIDLGVTATLVQPNPRVDAIRGSVAIQRGPLVYCLEEQDQAVHDGLLDVQLDPASELEAEWRSDLLDGVVVIHARGFEVKATAWGDRLYAPLGDIPLDEGQREAISLTAVPYCVWGNRRPGAMRVWIPVANPA